jgi:hypothetical protein
VLAEEFFKAFQKLATDHQAQAASRIATGDEVLRSLVKRKTTASSKRW